ncbi:MAG: anthranilate synthase component I family protein, partial [Ferruginibacter sp.]
MKKIKIQTKYKKLLADVYTPVGIYLRLRDRFRDTILLESSDFHAGENSYTFIGIHAIAGIEIKTASTIEYKLPAQNAESIKIITPSKVPEYFWDFMQRFDISEVAPRPINVAQGLFGYSTYDAVQFFDTIKLTNNPQQAASGIPLMRYRLYQYVIAINHFKNELFICENSIEGIDSEVEMIESLIRSKNVPAFP